MAITTRPARSRPDPIVTKGTKVAPVKANDENAPVPAVVLGDAVTTAGLLGVQLGRGTTVPAASVRHASTLAVGALKMVPPWATAHV